MLIKQNDEKIQRIAYGMVNCFYEIVFDYFDLSMFKIWLKTISDSY